MRDLLKRAAYRCGFSLRRMRGVTTRHGQQDVPGAIGSDGAMLMRAIHADDPYAGFDFNAHPFDDHGWGSRSGAFSTLIAATKPRLVIEVGTWKGGSAIEMCRHLDRLGLDDTRVLCIDTWLGALEMWGDQTDEERYGALSLRHGYPGIYYQFLANICHSGNQSRIIPFPLPSVTAAQWLSLRGVRAGLIYIDGSHEEEDVCGDLVDYWDLLSPGGVLFGDDYGWTGVRMAVDRFSSQHRLKTEHLEDKWVLWKPA